MERPLRNAQEPGGLGLAEDLSVKNGHGHCGVDDRTPWRAPRPAVGSVHLAELRLNELGPDLRYGTRVAATSADRRSHAQVLSPDCSRPAMRSPRFRSEERRVGKECRSRWSPYH